MTDDAVVLAGAGGFAADVTDVAADAGFRVAAWIEGLDADREDLNHEPPILWVDRHRSVDSGMGVVPAIGAVARRALLERLVSEGRGLITVVHPSAVVSATATIGPGCVIFPNVVIGARTHIEQGTIINRGALIGHHVDVGAWSFVGPGANIAANVALGSQVYLGIGSIIRDGTSIGAGATVGAGAVVIDDVSPGLTVVGIPARPIEPR